jgi:hypothetical protein
MGHLYRHMRALSRTIFAAAAALASTALSAGLRSPYSIDIRTSIFYLTLRFRHCIGYMNFLRIGRFAVSKLAHFK